MCEWVPAHLLGHSGVGGPAFPVAPLPSPPPNPAQRIWLHRFGVVAICGNYNILLGKKPQKRPRLCTQSCLCALHPRQGCAPCCWQEPGPGGCGIFQGGGCCLPAWVATGTMNWTESDWRDCGSGGTRNTSGGQRRPRQCWLPWNHSSLFPPEAHSEIVRFATSLRLTTGQQTETGRGGSCGNLGYLLMPLDPVLIKSSSAEQLGHPGSSQAWRNQPQTVDHLYLWKGGWGADMDSTWHWLTPDSDIRAVSKGRNQKARSKLHWDKSTWFFFHYLSYFVAF